MSETKETEIVYIRLRYTPEEFIAEVLLDGPPEALAFKNPLIPVHGDGGTMGLMPWCIWSLDREFMLPLTDILLTSRPLPALINGYHEMIDRIRQHESGIQIAPASALRNPGNVKPIR